MSAKSALKLLVHDNAGGGLYTWVALLTGSKNTLKGAGFFLGGALLAWVGFQGAVAAMAATLALVWLASLGLLTRDLGKASAKPKFSQIFSKSTAVNYLSAARMCLFCARDIWFVVALPVYLTSVLGWDHWQVGGFLALWVIGYGAVQATSPRITRGLPDGRTVFWWAVALAIIPATIALLLDSAGHTFLLGGLLIFGVFFAVNSSLHSYLILSYASADSVSLDVGFYYMANAMGRLLGTVLSGWTYQAYGLPCCLWISAGLVTAAAILSLRLPRHT